MQMTVVIMMAWVMMAMIATGGRRQWGPETSGEGFNMHTATYGRNDQAPRSRYNAQYL